MKGAQNQVEPHVQAQAASSSATTHMHSLHRLHQELEACCTMLRKEVQKPSIFSPRDMITKVYERLNEAIEILRSQLSGPFPTGVVDAAAPLGASAPDQAVSQAHWRLLQLIADRTMLEQDRLNLHLLRREMEQKHLDVQAQQEELVQVELPAALDQQLEEPEAGKCVQMVEDEETINSDILLLSVTIPDINKIVAMSAEENKVARNPSEDLCNATSAKSESSPHGAVIAAAARNASKAVSSATACTESGHDTLAVPALGSGASSAQPEATAAMCFSELPVGSDKLKRDTIAVSLVPLGSGGLGQDPTGTLRQALESFSHNPKVSVAGHYKCGKSTLLKKLLGYPKGKCLHHPIHNTKGLNLYIGKTPGQPVFIDVEGFAQPLTTMDPYFLRELAMQFCATVSRCIILVVNHIDITDLQLIHNVRSIAKGVIVVVHNLMTVTSKADMDCYKEQITRSLNLVPNRFNEFALCSQDGSEVHYVIGHLIDDSEWNVKVGRRQETVFDVITRMHCNGESAKYDLEKSLQDAFSKVVSKYFDPVGTPLVSQYSAGPTAPAAEPRAQVLSSVPGAPVPASPPDATTSYFVEQTWCDDILHVEGVPPAPSRAQPAKVLRVTYVDVMRRVFAMYNLQPHSSLTYSWMRDDAGAIVYLVVNCPGFALTGLKFLNAALGGGADERTIMLIGTQQIYGRIELPVRELLRSPLPLIQNTEHVSLALKGRTYDRNGSLILAFKPNANAADVMTVLSAGCVFVALHDWDALDHRILGQEKEAGSPGKQCDCKTCAAFSAGRS